MKEGWEIKKLGDVCQFVRGPFGGSLKKNCFVDDGFAVYEQQHAIYNQFNDIRYFINESKFTEMKRFELLPGDLIMSCSGTMGKVAIVPDGIKKGIINQALLKLTPNESLNIRYLKYWMDSDEFEISISKHSKGAAIKNVASVQILKDIQIPCPNETEQQRITSILDEAFEAIDKARTNVQKNLSNAKELFQGELDSVFLQRGEGWVEKKLNEISENLDSKRIPITKNQRIPGEYPYYGASGIVDYVSDYIFDDDLLLVSEDGANLLARTYPIAFSISGKSWVNNHAHVLKFNSLTTQSYVEFYINSIKLDPFVSGMAQPKLNQAMLNKIPIPYPPLDQQQHIVTKLNMLVTRTKKLESLYKQKLIQL